MLRPPSGHVEIADGAPAPSGAYWRRSQLCELGNCVEVKMEVNVVSMRNSQRTQTQLTFGRTTWDAFMTSVKSGEFD